MDFMKQAQKMQKEMARVQRELGERVVEGVSGGGVVKVQVNGRQEVMAVKVDPEAVDPEDVEMLEDLILAATNDGLQKARDLAQREMSRVAGGMVPPGLMG